MDSSIPLSNMNVDTSRIQFVAIFGSVLLFLFILALTRKGAIRIPYSLLWFFLAAGFMIISVRRDFLGTFASMAGIAYAPAALFLLLILGIIGMLIHFSVVLSSLSERTCKLVQELGAMRLEIDKLSHRTLPSEQQTDGRSETGP
jgi:hypothetical protein